MRQIMRMLFVAFISMGFTDTIVTDPLLEITPPLIEPSSYEFHLEDQVVSKHAFFYVRFAAAERDLAHLNGPLPGLGIGYRRFAGDGAADISISGIGYAEKKNGQLFWTAPKASYIHYLKPNGKESFYMGGGLAWGGLDCKGQNFIGIIPSATGGYEFVRKSTILGFTEITFSQPALAVWKKGPFPNPILEWTMGIGF